MTIITINALPNFCLSFIWVYALFFLFAQFRYFVNPLVILPLSSLSRKSLKSRKFCRWNSLQKLWKSLSRMLIYHRRNHQLKHLNDYAPSIQVYRYRRFQHFNTPQICQNRSKIFSNIVFIVWPFLCFVMTDNVLLLNEKTILHEQNLHANKEFDHKIFKTISNKLMFWKPVWIVSILLILAFHSLMMR